MFLALAFAGGMLAGCGDSDAPSQAAIKSKKKPLRPEMVVKLAPGVQMGCVSDAALTKALEHSVRGEKSKFAAMFSEFNCMQLPSDQKYRLLSVGVSRVEFTHVSNKTASDGMWAPIETFEPADDQP
ncbi:hypothetical protein [Variovorax sp. 160MFSha2.1]|uniref:hypothetical protein n=1 Tax=Variovorax sp. 160MFSha2.1 TaxID=3158367 RepID=UPI003AAE11C2